jgi:hypothetical protein
MVARSLDVRSAEPLSAQRGEGGTRCEAAGGGGVHPSQIASASGVTSPAARRLAPCRTPLPQIGGEGLVRDARDASPQRVVEVGDQIVDVLDADGEADEGVADAQGLALLRRQGGMRHDRRVLDQALDAA